MGRDCAFPVNHGWVGARAERENSDGFGLRHNAACVVLLCPALFLGLIGGFLFVQLVWRAYSTARILRDIKYKNCTF
eukprot:scaffold1525_cov142-Cylindrotheca_fusiformis.AAC.10